MAHSTVFKEDGEIEGKMFAKKVEGYDLFKSVVTYKDLLIEDAERFSARDSAELEKYFTET